MKKRIIVFPFAVLSCLMLSCCSNPTQVGTSLSSDTSLGSQHQSADKGEAVFLDGTDGSDENSGRTPEQPVATLERAFELLSDNCNRIVIVGANKNRDNYTAPKHDGEVVITTAYDGVDYAQTNKAALNIGECFSFNCDVVLEDLRIVSSSKGARLCFNFNSVSIAENVSPNCTSTRAVTLVAGYNVIDKSLNTQGHMTAAQVSYKGDCKLTVSSGEWRALVGGNYRIGYDSPMGTFDGNMTVNIGGSASFVSNAAADDVEGLAVSASGHNITKGSVTLNISGGSIKCPVYGIGKVGRYYNFTAANGQKGTDGTQFGRDVRYEADVKVNISGGDFKDGSVIKALQAPGDTALHGDYTLSVNGTSFPDGFVFSGFGIIGKSTASGIEKSKAVSFDYIDGEKTDQKAPVRVACCGDSITFGTCAVDASTNGYTYAKENFFYPNVLQKLCATDAVVGNFGYPGAYVGTAYNKYYESCVYASLAEFEPDVILLALGTNNVTLMPNGKNNFITYYRIMLEDMHKRFPNAKIIMTTALYRWDKAENTTAVEQHIIPLQKQLAGEYDYVLLYDAYTEYKPYATASYYKDRLHPNNEGYARLAEVMKKALDSTIPSLAAR